MRICEPASVHVVRGTATVLFVCAGSQIKEENLEGTELSSERTETETNGSSAELFTNQDQ